MAASETRDGPGWWMDSTGGWNPPENWPESTPPLPGWIRGTNGLWSAPDMITPAPVVDASSLDLGLVRRKPDIDLTDRSPSPHRTPPPQRTSTRQRMAKPQRSRNDGSKFRSTYSPAHAEPVLGYQASVRFEASGKGSPKQAESELRLRYSNPATVPLSDDEPLISRGLKVGFALSLAAIGALIAGLVILVMVL